MPLNMQTILFKILGDNSSGVRALDQINKKLLGVGLTMTAMSDAALAAFVKLGQSGATLDALQVKFGRMAAAFGQTADQMLASWEEASLGTISQAEMMRKANQAALLGLPVDRMADLLMIARNAAEATGESIDYMFTSIVTGIGRKSRLILDNLGIIIDATEAYDAYGKTIGKVGTDLTSHEQTLAYLEAATAAAARQQEILGTATENASTRIQKAKAALKNVKDELSKAFIPVAEAAAKVVLFLTGIFEKIPKPVLQAIAMLLTLVAAFGAIVGPVAVVISLLPALQTILAAIGAAAGALAPVVALVALLTAGVALMARAWKENWGDIQGTVTFVIDTIRPYVQTIVYQIQYWVGRIKMQIEGIVQAIRALVEPALIRLRAMLGDGGGLKEFMVYLRDATGAILSFVEGILDSIRMVLEGKADKAWMPLKDAALNVITAIVIAWRKYISKALVWGWNLVVNLANGIIRAASTVLQQAAAYVGRILSGFWEAHSPPKRGPLAGILQWGKGLMETYLRGFKLADFGILQDVMDPVRQALTAAVGLGDIDEKTSLTIFRDVREQVSQLIADFRKTGQISQELMDGIAQRLGEGGQDYVEYLRLTLEHQKALESLKRVEDEVAAAEKKGFIPAALKDKLKAAQDEADATQDAADWQREYLAALQEGVDLQVQMVQAMRDLVDAIKGVKGAAGGGAIVPEDMTGGPVLPAPAEPIDFEGFGGFSAQFEAVKKEVADWFTALPGKINGWIEQARLVIAQKGLEIIANTRVTLMEIWAIIVFRFAQVMAIVAYYLSKWLVDARSNIEMIKAIIWGGLYWLYLQVYTFLTGIRDKLKLYDLMFRAIIWGGLLLVTIKIREFLEDIFERIRVTLLQIQGIAAGALLLLYLKVDEWLTKINTWIVTKFTEMKDAVGLFVTDFFTAGENIIQGLWDGLKARWDGVKRWFSSAIADLPQWMKDLLGIHSGSTVMRYLGEMTVKGFAEGLEGFSKLQGTLQQSIGQMLPGAGLGASLAAAGQRIFIVQVPSLSLPGIHDGRDAESLIRQILQQSVDAAQLRGFVPGGVM